MSMIGIDLGTTNSCMAFIEGGEPVLIPNADGGRTTPSVVAFTSNGERLVGETAKRQAVTNAQRTIASIKREMGTAWKTKIDGKSYTPQEISAMILAKLKRDAESFLGAPVTDAVITVPAYFSDAQRQATKDAGRIAGLNVRRIINEPTAAALAYGLDKQGLQKVMVFDLGGGTFDVSVLDIASDVIEVRATAGNNRLGGDDFDACLTDYLAAEFQSAHAIDLKRDATAMQRVQEAAEKAKIELSSVLSTTVSLPFLAMGKSGPVHMETTITRAKFDELTRHLVDMTMGPVQQAMADAGYTPDQLDKVLLVGGSSRIPAVQAAVKRFTGKEPSKGIHPDECVAMGAALQGGVMLGEVKDLVLLDVTPLSLGIETVGHVFSKIIDRNTPIPVERSEIYTTAAPFQSSVEINVLQGERRISTHDTSLGKFKLTGIRRAMAGVPQIQVTFSIDTNGIVHVSARDLDTGRQQEIVISGSSNMSQADIDRAIREAQEYEAADRQKAQEENQAHQLEATMYRLDNARKGRNPAEKARIVEALKGAERARKSKDPAQMRQSIDEMNAVLSELGLSPVSDEASANGASADANEFRSTATTSSDGTGESTWE